MKIKISQPVLSEPKWFPILDVILLIIEDSRHSIAAEELYTILESQWVKDRPRDVRELIRTAATTRSYDAEVDKSTITIDSSCPRGGICEFEKDNTILHPLDAIFFISTPFQVIVENENFDGAFILWMARAAGYTKLLTAYRSGRFVFRHAGGKDSIYRSANIFSKGVWARNDNRHEKAFRLWLCAILDNDATHPNHKPNKDIISRTQRITAFVHELRKRSIESYIPAPIIKKLDNSKSSQEKVDALFRMTEQQRNHYHMKRGFRFRTDIIPTKANYMAHAKHEEKSLYNSVNEQDWEKLMDGFGSGLSKIYTEEGSRPNPNDVLFSDSADREEILKLVKAIYQRI